MEVTQTVSGTGSNFVGFFIIAVSLMAAVLILAGLTAYFWKFLVGFIKYKDREKESMEFVLLQVIVPRDNEIKIDAAEQLFGTFASIKKSTGKIFGQFKPQPQMSFELVALHESIRFFVSCHKKHQDLIEKQINGAYPDADIQEVEEYNIFSETGQTAYASLKLRGADYFPIKTFRDLPTDPLSSLTSALAKMQPGEGAAIQMIITPADSKWKDFGKKWLKKEKDPGKPDSPKPPPDAKQVEAVEQKLARPGFNTAIRVVVSAGTTDAAKAHLSNIRSAFEQFNGPYNGFSGVKIRHEKGFLTDFIYRFLPKYIEPTILTSDELASIFHFPNKAVETPYITWLSSKRAPAPEKIPTACLYLGKSVFRGVERPFYIAEG